MRLDYLWLALLWIAYCTIHSALISIRAVGFFKHVLGARYCFYRLFFNTFSLFTLIPLLLYSRAPQFQDPHLVSWIGNWQIVRWALIGTAVVLLFAGARHYSMSQFLGLLQIRSNRSTSGLTKSGELDTQGVMGAIRHPWYLAVFILLWASDQSIGSIIINAVLSTYLVIGTLLEERKLSLEFGEKYREYQKKVSMFIPLKWLNLKLRH
jgi:methanethiol S-methyltransferase